MHIGQHFAPCTHLLHHRVGDKVDAPEPGVLVARVEGLVRVAEVVLGTLGSEPRRQVRTAAVRPVPRPEQRRRHHEGQVVSVRPPAPLDGQSDVHKRHVVVADAELGPCVEQCSKS